MIIDCISDLHGYFPELDGGDLLIVVGDLTANDIGKQYENFNTWLLDQEYTRKIIIAGNHDGFMTDIYTARLVCMGAEYLYDSGTEFEGLKIWGSPWTLKFPRMNPKCMAFTVDTEEQLKEKWDMIPDDIDILITHSPPHGILDKCPNGNVGSKSLSQNIEKLKPKLHVFGHIHECGGSKVLYKHNGPNTWCVNASIVNERYEHVNKPIRMKL